MRNIYLLQSDQASILAKNNLGELLKLRSVELREVNINQNLYITSEEEIKEVDYVLNVEDGKVSQVKTINGNNGYITNGTYYIFDNRLTVVVYDRKFQPSSDNTIHRRTFNIQYKKIILTTDPALIKAGVQSIDSEFLKWFVKNPGCEWVATKIDKKLSKKEIYDASEGDLVYNNHTHGGIIKHLSNDIRVTIEDENGGYVETAITSENGIETLTINNYKIYDRCYDIIIPNGTVPVKCYDKFNQLLSVDDYVDVQQDGTQQIYSKEDGELYFTPYGKEDRVSAYFSNDLAKCDEVGNWINNDQYEDIFEKYFGDNLRKYKNIKTIVFNKPKETLEEVVERMYTEDEAGELVYNIMGEYAKTSNIIIDGVKLNELFNKYKKK